MDYVDDYIFDGPRILLGEDGTVVTSDGHPVLQYVWGKYWVNNHAHVLRPSGAYSLESIYMALSMASASRLVTGAVQPKINQRNLGNLSVLMPAPDSLGFLKPIFSSYRTRIEENRRLDNLRDSLLPKLMSGEIDVSKVEVPTPPNSHLRER
jgi:type I restriction enzyme S subunit